jgi:hypothetical protein
MSTFSCESTVAGTAPNTSTPLPKDRAVLTALLEHCKECAAHADRVRHRNQRLLLQLHDLGNGVTVAELQACIDAISDNQARDQNDFIPDPRDLWKFCDSELVAKMEELGEAGSRTVSSWFESIRNQAEADEWAACAVCWLTAHNLRTDLLMTLKDKIATAIEAQHSSEGIAAALPEAVEHSGNTSAVPVRSGNAQWSEPDAPSQWAKRFGCSWDTLKRRFADGSIRHLKLSTKSYRIHLDDVPTKR